MAEAIVTYNDGAGTWKAGGTAPTTNPVSSSDIPQGGPLTTDLDADGFKIENAADPTNQQDYATKAYGDANWGAAGGIGAILFDSTLVADTASIDTGAAGIAGGYKVLMMTALVQTDNVGALASVDLIVNNDTGNNYDAAYLQGFSGAAGAGTFLAQARWRVNAHGSGGTANQASSLAFLFPNYTSTTFNKAGEARDAVPDGTAGNNVITYWSLGYRSTAAISRAKLAGVGAAKLKAGTRLTIIGW